MFPAGGVIVGDYDDIFPGECSGITNVPFAGAGVVTRSHEPQRASRFTVFFTLQNENPFAIENLREPIENSPGAIDSRNEIPVRTRRGDAKVFRFEPLFFVEDSAELIGIEIFGDQFPQGVELRFPEGLAGGDSGFDFGENLSGIATPETV